MSMLPNPGGRLALDEIIGRNREITRYWRVLSRQGLILSAERRIGKTSIVQKMAAQPPDGFYPIYQDLEGVHSLLELVRSVYRAVGEHLELPRMKKLKAKALGLWAALGPRKLGEIDVPQAGDRWKDLLASAIDDALSVFDSTEKLVFVWDEFPLMLFNIRERAGAESAIQLLDVLRQLRHTRAPQLRFLFTGSVGLHLVLRELRVAKNANSPVNDMQADTVPPMSKDDALELAHLLLSSFEPAPSDIEAVGRRMFDVIGGFPFYLQHAADQLSLLERQAVPDDVDTIVHELLLSNEDPAQFAYHAQRISTYYHSAEAPLALAVLNAIAGEENSVSLTKVIDLVRHRITAATDEDVRSICQLLRQDHYLTLTKQNGHSVYEFRWPLLRRWWRENRL